MSEELSSKFISYYSSFSNKDYSLVSFERIFGGASRETYKIEVKGDTVERLILRVTQDSSLIETEQETEYLAYSAFQNSAVPVPDLLDMSEDKNILGAQFMLMKELKGEAASPFTPGVYSPNEKKLGYQFWSILGEIAKKDINKDIFEILAEELSSPSWKNELDKWVKVIHEDSISIEPILEAGIRTLYRNPPKEPERLSIVHGDYRSGNFLFLNDQITGILDWEMAHIGNPLEDLGWALSPIWSWQDRKRPGYLIQKEEALKVWESSSNIKVDPVELKWWELFAAVKGMAIWISAGNEFKSGKNIDPINLFSAWIPGDIHLEVILDILEDNNEA